MSVVKSTTGFVVRNRKAIARTALYFGAVYAAEVAIGKLVLKNS